VTERLWIRTALGLFAGLLAAAAVVFYLGISQRELLASLNGVAEQPLLMAAACAAGYLAQPSNQQPNGGTWLGLTLGTIAAAMILILMGYGIRRRTFRASVGSATRWLSIHVYLGLCTVVIASLHCGFQFGGTRHQLALLRHKLKLLINVE